MARGRKFSLIFTAVGRVKRHQFPGIRSFEDAQEYFNADKYGWVYIAMWYNGEQYLWTKKQWNRMQLCDCYVPTQKDLRETLWHSYESVEDRYVTVTIFMNIIKSIKFTKFANIVLSK